jgi:hypothetical protein
MPVILVTWEAEIQKITTRGQPWQKVSETPISTDKNWVWGHASVKWEDSSAVQPGQKARPRGLEVWLKWYSICLASSPNKKLQENKQPRSTKEAKSQ